MFLEWWMILIVAVVTGVWSELRYNKGLTAGIFATVHVLADHKLIELDEQGRVKGIKRKLTNI